MKILQLLFLLTSLLGLYGCERDCNVGSGPLPSLPVEPQALVVGQPATVGVRAMVRGGCPGNWHVDGVPAALRVELTDPDGQPVETETRLYEDVTAGGSFYFTPDKPGRYHAITTFEPVGGFNQFDLHAMRDHSTELPIQTLTRTCDALERTERGGWLCDTDFLRAGAVEQRFTDNRVAVAGDVVWVVNETRIQRFVDTGSTLELTASLEHSQGTVEFLLGSVDELVILHGLTFQRVTFTGAALTSTGISTWVPGPHRFFPLGPPGIPIRRGDQLAIITYAPTSSAHALEACPYRLEQGRFVRTSASCQTFPAGQRVVGFEPGVLWLGTSTNRGEVLAELRRLEWGETELVERGALTLGFNFQMTTQTIGLRTSIVPVLKTDPLNYGSRIRSAVVAWSPEKGTLLLQMLDPDVAEAQASTRLFWGPPSTGTTSGLRVRIRPPTP
jgi:hypothetical protein